MLTYFQGSKGIRYSHMVECQICELMWHLHTIWLAETNYLLLVQLVPPSSNIYFFQHSVTDM